MTDATDFEEAPEELATEPAPAPKGRSAVVVGARMLTGAVGVAVAALAIAGATWLPLPTIGGDVRALEVQPTAAGQERVCAGSLLRFGDESGQDARALASIGAPDIRFAATDGTPRLQPMAGGVGAPHRVTLEPTGTEQSPFGASQSQAGEEFAGFAAAQCAMPTSQTWLVGGASTTGRVGLIRLVNPSTVDSLVDLTIHTENGIITAAGTAGIVVPPGGERVLPLAGFAPDAASPVIRVVSRGGEIVATLQQSIVRTLAPSGVDLIGGVDAPATGIVIPGFVINGGHAAEELTAGATVDDAGPVIRLLAPGNEDATAMLSMTPENGSAAGDPVAIDLTAGQVLDVALDHIEDGSYTVRVDATLPVVAAARSTTADGEGGTDFAWFGAAPALSEPALLSVAPGPWPALHLVNPTEQDAEVTLRSETGSEETVSVQAGAAAVVPVPAGGTFELDGSDQLHVSVSYRSATELAGFVVTGPSPLARDIRVLM